MPTELRARIAKAFRVRGPGVRQIYVNARRASRFLRDAPRRSALAALPPTDITIGREAGFFVVPPGRFEETPAIVADARAALVRYDASAPPDGKNRKRFLQNVLDADTLTIDSAIVRFALREDVLAAVSTYLGVVPLLTTISVFHSDTVDADPTSSQLYHCDGDDVTQIKIFVYCTDVDVPSGPLTLLDAATTRHVQRRTGYWYRNRLTDDQVRTAIGTPREHAILGPTGTSAFVDTSRCFHFGSRVAPGAPPRLAAMIQYQTPYSFMLPSGVDESALPFRRLATSSLSPLQRLVLGQQ
jgi:hypothetical protein